MDMKHQLNSVGYIKKKKDMNVGVLGVVGRANELDMTKIRCIYRSETDKE